VTTSAAGNLAVEKAIEKKDEKSEKRKALGRGLASLLPGPRVVPSSLPTAEGGETKIPRYARDDKGSGARDESTRHETGISTQPQSPLLAKDARNGAPSVASAVPSADAAGASAESVPRNVVVNLSIDFIEKNPYQTRYVFDEGMLVELRDSIKEHGVVQPVVVRPADGGDGRYILVLGERRLRASKMAGRETIPALVRTLSPQQAAEMTVLENVVRADLNPVEQAEAFRVLSKEFHLTQAQIAERIGVSRETVANYMRLLRLPQKVMSYMLEGRLSFSDARELLRLEKEEHIEMVAEELVMKRLKWDEIDERVRKLNEPFLAVAGQPDGKKNSGARWMDPNVRAAQTEMERTLGMRVRIRDRNGKGKITIEYATVDDYERVVEKLRAN
jgi:ParB family transcriptional regulator, chromosome partitioning protein